MPSRWVTFALIALISTQSYSAQKKRGGAHRVAQPPPLSVDIPVINNPQQPDLPQGAKGSPVVRAQILLARAHFSCGEIDANFGTNLDKTVRAFQGDRKLPVTGVVDPATWAALNADTAPPIMTYTTTQEDVQGPFTAVPSDMKAQAKLPALGYSSAREALAERFHASPAVMHALNPNANFDHAGVLLNVPNVLTMPPGQAARVIVSKGESSVRAIDADGKLLAFYVATIGSEHDPLPVGEWKIRGVARNPKFHYNAKLFWDAKNTGDRATIQPGPNNPVGLVWIDLSKEHYGIHGTPQPDKVGHAFSHGCIRLTNWDAMELAAMVKPNTPATLQE
jgi:lipoprotein-anchoring transpeptidase ErfK/SrfK